MKGLILSGGKGTRLRPFTYTRAKQLLPLANKPVLFYAIESLLAAGVREIGIIVGDTAAEIAQAVGDGQRWGADVRISLIEQEAPLGLAHAVLTAQPFVGEDKFVMFLGDNLIGEALGPLVRDFDAPDSLAACHILLTPVENPSQFGVAELEPEAGHVQEQEHDEPESAAATGLRTPHRGASTDGRAAAGHMDLAAAAGVAVAIATADAPADTHAAVTAEAAAPRPALRVRRLVEKPVVPPSNLALVGIYCFTPAIFTAARSISPSARGELEITDAIQWLIDSGYDVRAERLRGYWIDTGKMADILDANRQVLAGIERQVDASAVVSADSVLQGAVVVQPGARIEQSMVRGPAIIGARSVIRNAYVGPFTSIYHDATIANSEIEYSIVLEHSRVEGVRGRIEASLIGRYSEVQTAPEKPRAHKLMLGDHSRVELGPD